jgi:NAD(P)-dependent dehydrogenase (short-subunit alcohol dehydrogenase family)
MGAFEGKVAIVVGGGRGVGRSTALALAREGARVCIVDSGCETNGEGHDPNVARAIGDEVRAVGTEALTLDLDAAQPGVAQRIVEATCEAFGRVDVGFYSAGFSRERALVRTSDDDFDAVLDVHVRGAFRFMRELANKLVEQRQGGSILLTTSGAGLFGSAGQSALAAASGAISGLTKTAATELRRHGIRVNALAPTARTRLTEELPLFRSIRADSLTPEHVAQVACHLLSDAARDVHGEIVGVAGGRIYSFRVNETSGLFEEGPPISLGALADAFRQVTRG